MNTADDRRETVGVTVDRTGQRVYTSAAVGNEANALAPLASRTFWPSTPPFNTRSGWVFAKVEYRLRYRSDVGGCAVGCRGDQRKRCRADEHVIEIDAELAGSDAHEGVLVDLVLTAWPYRVRRRPASSWTVSFLDW